MALLLMAMVITVVVVRSNFRIHCHGKDICVYRSFWQPWWWWKCPYHHNFAPQKTDSDVWSRCIPQFHMHNHACFALGQRWGCKEIKNSVISGDVVILRINHPEYCHEWLVKQPKKCRDNAIGFGTLWKITKASITITWNARKKCPGLSMVSHHHKPNRLNLHPQAGCK